MLLAESSEAEMGQQPSHELPEIELYADEASAIADLRLRFDERRRRKLVGPEIHHVNNAVRFRIVVQNGDRIGKLDSVVSDPRFTNCERIGGELRVEIEDPALDEILSCK